MQNRFPENDEVLLPTAILNNMLRIIMQETAITANQHRDLQNQMALALQQAIPYDQLEGREA
jgi:hypothetical protein